MRIFYLPVIEPGAHHAVALANKRGLLTALQAYGTVLQFDYLDVPIESLFPKTLKQIDAFQPDLMVTQLHGPDRLTAANLAAIRARYPALRIVNWSGDSWLHSLVSPGMLELCQQFDLQLVATPDVLPIYAEHGIRAAFWQIAWESSVGSLPAMPVYDVVFLANVISEKRRLLMQFLRSLAGITVGIYGDGEGANGQNVYDFGQGEALYRNAKIAIADNVYPDQLNYVSNRPIQALMAGGALLLHQHVPKMTELLGIQAGVHYIEWSDFAELERAIRFYLDPFNERQRQTIVWAGQRYAEEHHTYTERARVLFEQLLRGALAA